jgi:hypothetical protein
VQPYDGGAVQSVWWCVAVSLTIIIMERYVWLQAK